MTAEGNSINQSLQDSYRFNNESSFQAKKPVSSPR
jgi:hypothetical protein